MTNWGTVTLIVLCVIVPFIFGSIIFPEERTFFLVMASAILGLTFVLLFLGKHRDSSIKNTISSVVADFGKIVSSNDADDAKTKFSFERNGAVFQIQILETRYYSEYHADFDIHSTGEKFFIQNDTHIFPKPHLSDCQAVQSSNLTKRFLLYSRNTEFLLNLLGKKDVQLQIENYPESTFMLSSLLKIAFENGHFEIVWRNSSHDMNNKIRRVCETAIVFHDRIKELIN